MSKRWMIAQLESAGAVFLAAGLFGPVALAQAIRHPLPDAPTAQLIAVLEQAPTMHVQPQTAAPQTPAASAATTPSGPRLTLAEAEQMAIQHNPNISVARLLALAQAQVTREARSIEMPTAGADLDAVDAHPGSRITGAGTINSPRILDKAAAGLSISQLITDFGRTHNLVLSAKSNAKAQLESERATELDITLTLDQAFYQALTAQAVLKVAQETVAQRQSTVDEVGALTKAKIRSDLDLSFANVQNSQAKLLVLDAQNSEQAAIAELNNVLGSDQDQQYTLVDETNGTPPPAPDDPEAMVQAAITARPDLASLSDKYLSAKQYATAERDLWAANDFSDGDGRRHAGARRSDRVFMVLWRRRQHQHPSLQRFSLQRRGKRSQVPGTGRARR
jgi:outer membrane protein